MMSEQIEIPLLEIVFSISPRSFDVSLDSTPVGKDFESLIAYLRNMLDKYNDDFCTAFYCDLERLANKENGECTC